MQSVTNGIGCIESRQVADSFPVSGDPTSDLRLLKAVRMVVADGVIYYPPQIHAQFGIRPFAQMPVVTLPPTTD